MIAWLLCGVALAAEPPGGLDGLAVYEVRETPATASDWLVGASLGVGGATGATLSLTTDSWEPVLGSGAALGVAFGITFATKGLVDRPRPYTYGLEGWSREGASEADLASMPSGHTSLTAVSWFSAATALDLQGELGPGGRAAAYGLAAVATVGAGSLRVAAGKHFPTDVLTGALVGAASGVLVPRLVHRLGEG